MKDAYSFDLDYAGARAAYNRMFVAYLRTFARLGLQAIPMRADSGPIGGDLSHEFVILADTGESAVFCDKALLDLEVPGADTDFRSDLSPIVERWTAPYAATDEKHDEAAFAKLPQERRVAARGIEVGHIFYFGTKYLCADAGAGHRPRRCGPCGAYGLIRGGGVAPRRCGHRSKPRRPRGEPMVIGMKPPDGCEYRQRMRPGLTPRTARTLGPRHAVAARHPAHDGRTHRPGHGPVGRDVHPQPEHLAAVGRAAAGSRRYLAAIFCCAATIR